MSGTQLSIRKTHLAVPRPPFDTIALILQGGGALGAYQAGVYQALAEADLHPDWVAGISIGAVNAALIVGNPPERRVERLREFWETVTAAPLGGSYFPGDRNRRRNDPSPRQPSPRRSAFWSAAHRDFSRRACRRPISIRAATRGH